MSSHTIRLVRDFSPNPFGRYLDTDGPRSAEAFRTKHLVPALNAHRHVVVDLSGYNYYGSTFLEEPSAASSGRASPPPTSRTGSR